MKRIPLILIILLITVSCEKKNAARHEKIKAASWLLGSWEQSSPQGTMTEHWEKTNDSTFHGQSYFMKGKDTLHKEAIVLSQRGETMTYEPTVQGQNNNRPIEFKMTSATANKMVFENPKHDFPKKIVYFKITSDSLVAEISGTQQGKASSERYGMRKK